MRRSHLRNSSGPTLQCVSLCAKGMRIGPIVPLKSKTEATSGLEALDHAAGGTWDEYFLR